MTPDFAALSHVTSIGVVEKAEKTIEDKAQEKLPQDFFICLSEGKKAFNYNFEKLVFSIFSSTSPLRTLMDVG